MPYESDQIPYPQARPATEITGSKAERNRRAWGLVGPHGPASHGPALPTAEDSEAQSLEGNCLYVTVSHKSLISPET